MKTIVNLIMLPIALTGWCVFVFAPFYLTFLLFGFLIEVGIGGAWLLFISPFVLLLFVKVIPFIWVAAFSIFGNFFKFLSGGK